MLDDLRQRAAQVKLLIFDVDGVLTDGRLLFTSEGHQYKAFHARDGLGMVMLQRTAVTIAVISGGESTAVQQRMNDLGIRYVFQGQQQKLPVFQQLCQDLALTPQQTAYVGDDFNDIPVLKTVGLAIAVANAHPILQQYTHWQTQQPGGHGAAREVCELIMQAQDTWLTQLAHYAETEC